MFACSKYIFFDESTNLRQIFHVGKPNVVKIAKYSTGKESRARDHRGLSRTLYIAKPNTANTVAPTLTLSQKVELFRSAWLNCLLKTEG